MADDPIKFEQFTGSPGTNKTIFIVAILFAVIALAFSCFGIVPAGYEGVLLRFGAVSDDVKGSGLYYKIPFVEQVVLMSTQIQKYTTQTTASSKDLQVVTTEVTLNFQLDPAKVAEIYRTMRKDYVHRIIQPFVQEAVKSVAANFDAEELITQRPKVKKELQELLAIRLKPLGLDVIELSITEFQFTQVFQDSIEAKVKAVQQALEAQNALVRVEYEAKQAVVKAQAEAKGLELQKAQISDQLLQLRKIEVQRLAVQKWNGMMPSVVTGSGPVPMLDVFKTAKQ